jgi:signal recognition particle subunit SEC65
MSAYEIPRNASHSRDYTAEFRLLPNQLNVVNHSEFESAVAKVKRQAEVEDDVYPDFQKATVLAVQRCRRGGTTSMLHKIAAQISTELPLNSRVVFIYLNSVSTYDSFENAYTAILSRIVWELSGRPSTFRLFRRSFTDFREIDNWLEQAKVILILAS